MAVDCQGAVVIPLHLHRFDHFLFKGNRVAVGRWLTVRIRDARGRPRSVSGHMTGTGPGQAEFGSTSNVILEWGDLPGALAWRVRVCDIPRDDSLPASGMARHG